MALRVSEASVEQAVNKHSASTMRKKRVQVVGRGAIKPGDPEPKQLGEQDTHAARVLANRDIELSTIAMALKVSEASVDLAVNPTKADILSKNKLNVVSLVVDVAGVGSCSMTVLQVFERREDASEFAQSFGTACATALNHGHEIQHHITGDDDGTKCHEVLPFLRKTLAGGARQGTFCARKVHVHGGLRLRDCGCGVACSCLH